MTSPPPPITCDYELDERLIITAVGGTWDQFAVENGAPELVAPAPIGRPLLAYFADATTVHLYERLFERAVRTRRPVSFPLRCDSPDLRRDLEVSITRGARGGFAVSNRLIRTAARDRITLLALNVPRQGGAVLMCSWCKRVDAHGRWLEVEDAIRVLRLFQGGPQPEITHGICDACHTSMRALLDLDAIRAKRD